jgi:uncharacterized NAD(P)/FAD-binding protein YdhS
MKRLRPYWEVVRHRAAEESLAVVEAWTKRGSLEIVRGQLARVQEDADRFDVTISSVATTTRRQFDRMVLCTGPETDVRRWTAPLFRQLLRDGLIQADALGIGLQTNVTGQALGAREAAVPWLYTLGGLRRPHLWETTSVPDIVRQAEALSCALLASANSGV